MKTVDRIALVAFAAALVVYLVGAAGVPFYDKAEPREALVVRALLEGRGIALPMRDGVEVPSKPPFFHWLAALAVAAGVRPEELAIRLPSVVAGAVGVGLTALVTGRAYGPVAGVASAVVLGTAFEWLRAATQSRVDMTLALAVLIAILALRTGAAAPDRRWLVRVGWLAVAAGVLAKGPVGAVLPLAVVAVDAFVARAPTRLRRLADPVGIALAVLVVGGWLVAAWRTGGEAFVARQALHENVARALGGDDASHAKPFHYYVPALAASFLPWTLAWPAAVARLRRVRTDDDRFFGLWAATVLVLFSLASGKRSVYVLPLYPALAALTGAGIGGWLERPPGRLARTAAFAGVVVVGVLAVVLAFGADRAVVGFLDGVLHERDREALPVVATLIADHRGWAVAAFAVLAAAIGALAVPPRAVRLAALVVAGVVWAAALPALGTRPLARASTPASFATAVRATVGDAPLCARGWLDYGLRWYLARPVPGCGKGTPAARVFVLRAPGPASAGCTVRAQDDRPLADEKRWMLEECGGAA
jgi:hypothetical protein